MLLEAGGRRVKALALVDSGADVSFLPHVLASDLKCVPETYDLTYKSGDSSFPAGEVLTQAHLLLSKHILTIPPSHFLVPAPDQDFPFVVLGRDPLFQHAEVRFRDWESRLGFSPRPPPWMRGRSPGLIGPVRVDRRARGKSR